MDPRLTVIIATKDRPDDCRKAIASVRDQTEPATILVVDDGSATPFRAAIDDVTVRRQETSLGCVPTRQRASLTEVQTRYFAYVDDDAVLVDPETLERAIALLEEDASLAAVALPYHELTDDSLHCVAPDDHNWIVDSFTGLGAVIRTDDFREIGGFRVHLRMQGEERDLCLRWLDDGKYVALLPSVEPMAHRASLVRNWHNMHFYGRRNDVLFAWENLPPGPAVVMLGRAVWRTMTLGPRKRGTRSMFRGMVDATRLIASRDVLRVPVRSSTYREWQELAQGPREAATRRSNSHA